MREMSNLVGQRPMPSGITSSEGGHLKFMADGSLYSNRASVGQTYNLGFDANLELPLVKSNYFNVTLTGNTTLVNPSKNYDGNWTLIIEQDSIGGHVVAFGSTFKVAQGTIAYAPKARTLVQIIATNGEYHVSMTTLTPAP